MHGDDGADVIDQVCSPPLGPWWRPVVLPIAALLLFIFCYSLNSRLVTGGDTLAHLYVAGSVWGSGDFDLSEFEGELRGPDGALPYYVVEDGGRLRTIFSFFPGTLLAPAGLILDFLGEPTVTAWAWAGKVLNVLLTGGAGVFLWLLLRRRMSPGFALVMTLAFWLATPLWALSMSYLQHQPGLFFQMAALWLLLGQEERGISGARWRLAGAGLCMGLAVLARYQVALVAVPLALVLAWLLRGRWRDWLCFAGGACVPAILLLLYNRVMVGNLFDAGYVVYPWATLGAPFPVTAAGLILNPSKGLLIHSPWLAFTAVGLWMAIWSSWKGRGLSPLLLVGALTPWPLIILYANYTGWFGGWSWGYRFLLDVLPQLTLLAAFGAWEAWRRTRAWQAVVFLVILAGMVVQAVGALSWDNEWHRHHDLGTMPHQDWLWQGRNSQPLWYARRGRLYLGEQPVMLRRDPFAARGLYEAEEWDGKPVAWTGRKEASLYLTADVHPLTLRLFPSPAAGEDEPLRVTVLVNGREEVSLAMTGPAWHALPLPSIPFQHAATITIRADRLWREPGETGRSLGVAVELPARQATLTRSSPRSSMRAAGQRQE